MSRKSVGHINKLAKKDLKKILTLFLCIICVLSCKQKTNTSKKDNLQGEYFYSKDKNISYFIPHNFIPFVSNNENDYSKIVASISNEKLRWFLSGNYIEGHILPIAENFQFLYKEDTLNYQNIFINEVKHIRLNDETAKALSNMNKRFFTKVSREYSAKVNWEKDYIVNENDNQIIVNSGNMVIENDTIYWENYIVSKFYRTFTITTKSSQKINFLPYVKKVQFGDKRQNL